MKIDPIGLTQKPFYVEVISRAKGFYWRIICRRNGKFTAIGGEPFASKQSCMKAFKQHGKNWLNIDKIDLKK